MADSTGQNPVEDYSDTLPRHFDDDRITLQKILVRQNAANGVDPVTGAGGGASGGFGSANTASKNVSVTTASTALYAARATACVMSFFNHGTANVELCYGATAVAGNGFYILFPNGLFETPIATTSAISGISATGTNIVTAVEYVA